jgi:FMN-dependent oxidoreductase (nitrilotriacetate monooxygenase family)
MNADKQMRLALMHMNTGVHIASWQDPKGRASDAADINHYIKNAQQAERGKFDLVFDTDSPGVSDEQIETWSRRGFRHTKFEPLTLLSVIASHTKYIGLGGTMSTSFNQPFSIARLFASLDLISGGRSAWNVVTSANDYAARVYGLDKLPPHDDRYARAHEFVEVVKGFWDTYEDDAFVWDIENSRYIDPDKFHSLQHEGEHFKVRGALALMRSPQGQPVIAQAGLSNAGRELAAETAEIIFGSADTIPKALEYYNDVKGRMAKYGRESEDLKILPGFSMMLADSKEEAEEKFHILDELVHPDVMRQILEEDLEMDLRGFPLDEPIPVEALPETSNSHLAYFNYLSNIVRTEKPTMRKLYQHWAGRGRNTFCGTPMQAADRMEEFFLSGGLDGFMISFQTTPEAQLEIFVEKVIPELQRRGLFRTEYAGKTLRENLNLKRPPNRYLNKVKAIADAGGV